MTSGLMEESHRVSIPTARGPVSAVYHAVLGSAAVLMVGGTDGGVLGPADAIYPTLAADLTLKGIASLSVDFRDRSIPGELEEGVHDVQAGISFLKEHGGSRVALVGNSFGGAVVITAAAQSPDVVAVVTLSTQSAGTALAPQVSPRPLLLVHGTDDIRLPPISSEQVFTRAREPKELVLLRGARHSLRQSREELRALLVRWLTDKLTLPRA